MKSNTTLGKFTWWSEHLALLVICGLLLQIYAWSTYKIILHLVTYGLGRRGESVADVLNILLGSFVTVFCCWWGYKLIKKMMNKA